MKYSIKEVSEQMVHNCDIEDPHIIVDEEGIDAIGMAMTKEDALAIVKVLNDEG
jgi:hypothetical protein